MVARSAKKNSPILREDGAARDLPLHHDLTSAQRVGRHHAGDFTLRS
jgi:hypothetical protein